LELGWRKIGLSCAIADSEVTGVSLAEEVMIMDLGCVVWSQVDILGVDVAMESLMLMKEIT